ncbi:DRTGG domain-containing protein [Clostridium sp. DMHC 10]|uniref:DRTGG domain-containing protein n=1 Tax=Clostridium sp. DMHC 10 TaxID=747377 RepID=UPI000A68FE9C
MSKHEEIIRYIMTLKAGTKISVRSIANKLEVSEGTAYRAIKECDNLGLVTTIPRVGTIKIDKVQKKNIEVLTYGEIVSIIDGSILGGRTGIDKTLNKFVIGAMTAEAMDKYISPGSLTIVGNREDAQKVSLLNNSAVLITGGFGCSDEIKSLADEKQLPVISSNYDTFTIASIINKAISENLIKKDIILVEDIMNDDPQYLKYDDSAKKLKKYEKMSGIHKLPVVNKNKKVIGVINFKRLSEKIENEDVKSDYIVGKYINEEPFYCRL